MGGDSGGGLSLTPPMKIDVNGMEESKKANVSDEKTGTETPQISVNELFSTKP